jgi:hypothetical protein
MRSSQSSAWPEDPARPGSAAAGSSGPSLSTESTSWSTVSPGARGAPGMGIGAPAAGSPTGCEPLPKGALAGCEPSGACVGPSGGA